jgi:hypothetical protein
VAVVDTEETQSLVCRRRLAPLDKGLQIQDARVGVFHADPPSLHRGHAENQVVAIAALRFLVKRTRQSGSSQRSVLCARALAPTAVAKADDRVRVRSAGPRRGIERTYLLNDGLGEGLTHSVRGLQGRGRAEEGDVEVEREWLAGHRIV